MAHCHPLLMMQSIHQAPDRRLASQAHAPDVFVLLALTQLHPSSQHQGKKPGQSMTALVLTKDSVLVGTSIGPNVRAFAPASATEACSRIACWQHSFWLPSRQCDMARDVCIHWCSCSCCSTFLCSFRRPLLPLWLLEIWWSVRIYPQKLPSGICIRY